MLSLYTNSRGVIGRYDKQWVITTTKQGATMLLTTSKDSTPWKQSNLKSIIDKYGIKKVKILCRDPHSRMVSGIAEELVHTSDTLMHNLEEELKFNADSTATSKYKSIIHDYFIWKNKGVPKAKENLLRDVIKLYVELQLEKDFYTNPHLMLFYTGFAYTAKKIGLVYEPMRLKDFSFNLNPVFFDRAKHSNRMIAPYINEVLEEYPKSSFFNKILNVENLHYERYFKNFLVNNTL